MKTEEDRDTGHIQLTVNITVFTEAEYIRINGGELLTFARESVEEAIKDYFHDNPMPGLNLSSIEVRA